MEILGGSNQSNKDYRSGAKHGSEHALCDRHAPAPPTRGIPTGQNTGRCTDTGSTGTQARISHSESR